jgi:hypothetical protein
MKKYLRVGLDELNALLDVLGQVAKAVIKELLLIGVDLTDGEDLLHTVGAELNLGGEEVDATVLVKGALNEGGLDNSLLALSSAEEGLGEASTSHGHGESGGAGTVLGLDDLITTELDAVDELVAGLAVNVGVVGLGKQRNNGHTGVATNNGNGLLGGIGALDFGDEARGTDDIKGCDTEETLGVVDTLGLEDLRDDGDGGVDLVELATEVRILIANAGGAYGVGDDEDVGLGGSFSSGLGKVTDDGSVGVEQVC